MDPNLSAAGIANWDMALFKYLGITERIGFDFRVEAFDPFNRVQFGYPGTQVGDSALACSGSWGNTGRIGLQ